MPFIQTFTGRNFYPLAPSVSDVDIRDIAHALANKCRYNGHCQQFYSVAQHSVLVCRYCENKKWGLLHDSEEAYLPDIPSPIKVLPEFAPLREAAVRIRKVVCSRFDLDPVEPEEVRLVDKRMMITEIRDLMISGSCWDKYYRLYETYDVEITPWPPRMAREIFLSAANSLGII